jgi:hypothetical protein
MGGQDPVPEGILLELADSARPPGRERARPAPSHTTGRAVLALAFVVFVGLLALTAWILIVPSSEPVKRLERLIRACRTR